MKKTVLLVIAGLLAIQTSFAQNPATRSASPAPAAPQALAKGSGKITGLIQDKTTGAPVEYASVALIHKASGKVVNGTITDDKGRFSIVGVAAAGYHLSEGQFAITGTTASEYRLTVSSLGYESFQVENFSVGNGKDEVQVGIIGLTSAAQNLKEVSVVGEKALIEDKLDRIVYNVEKDLNPGATAAEVMRKVPGLSVDLEGNIELRGSSNILVLINNKPSAVMAASLADALQQIPANQIKSVEVITSPSAQYDAEGTAGIINIITRKDGGLQVLTGSTFAALGTINSNAGGSLSYRRGKLGLSGSLGYALSRMRANSALVSDFGPGATLDVLVQDMEARREASSGFVQLGADYTLSKTSYLAAGARLSVPVSTIFMDQLTTSTFASGLNFTDKRKGSNQFVGNNYDINLDYTKTFKKPGQELSVLGLFSRNARDNDNLMELFAGNVIGQKEQNLNEIYNSETTFQTDYRHPISKTQLLEVGAKAIRRYAESDYRFLVADPAESPFLIVPGRTDVFSYRQDVLASYAMYGAKWNKYNLRLGLRYEHTWVEGDFISDLTRVAQEYDNLFPNISVSRNLKSNQTVKFNYTKRIQRPQLSYLNPYENVSNPRNVTRGNPDLEAELTDSYEVGFNTFSKSGASLTTSLYWRQTNNSIQMLSTPYTGANPDSLGRVTTSVYNTGRNGNYGLSLSGSAKFLKNGRINSNLNVFYATNTSRREDISNSGMIYNGSLTLSYSFGKGLSAQAAGDYTSGQVTLQARTVPVTTYNFALRKEVLRKKGTITLGVNNPFHKTILRQRTITTFGEDRSPLLVQTNTWNFYMRQVRLSFNYQFGKQDAKNKPRKTKSISNDDAKEDDDTGVQ